MLRGLLRLQLAFLSSCESARAALDLGVALGVFSALLSVLDAGVSFAR